MSTFSISETLYLVDAHPVNADAGGKFTGLILSTERTNVDGLLHWIVRRLVLSKSKTLPIYIYYRPCGEEFLRMGKNHRRIFIENVPQANNFYKFLKFL